LAVDVVARQPHRVLPGRADGDPDVVVETARDPVPPAVVAFAQRRHDLGMLGRDVAPLLRVLADIVELPPVDEPPARGHRDPFLAFDRLVHALVVNEQRSLRSPRLFAGEQGGQRRPVERPTPSLLQAAQGEERGKEVDVGRQARDVSPAADPAAPAMKSMAALKKTSVQ
jgi:hypothetical protein